MTVNETIYCSNHHHRRKACQVNLNHSAAVCANLTLEQHSDTQAEAQVYVAAVQVLLCVLHLPLPHHPPGP